MLSRLPNPASRSGVAENAPLFKQVVSVGVAAFALMGSSAYANDNYPSQTLKLIVPFAAGGLPDTVARVIATSLQTRLKQSVVVEDRPGAGGATAALAIASAPPDGYQFIVSDNSFLSTNPYLYKHLQYNPRDFVTVAQVANSPLFLALHPKVPAKTMRDFIDYVRGNPGKIDYGSSGIGSTHHLSMEAIKSHFGLDMAHIPFRGTGQSVPALLGGHVSALFSAYPSLSGGVESRQVTIVAENGAKRSLQFPDVPSVAEFIPEFDFAPRIGIFARVGTPDSIVNFISAHVVAIANDTDTIGRFSAVGIEAAGLPSDEFRKALDQEIRRVEAAVKVARIEPQ